MKQFIMICFFTITLLAGCKKGDIIDSPENVPGINNTPATAFDSTMSNGHNRVTYSGMRGYLVYTDYYSWGYFISDSGIRHSIPWTGSSYSRYSSDEYTKAVAVSWGWDMLNGKKISQDTIEKYPVSNNILVKSGFLYTSEGKYYQVFSPGNLKQVSREEANGAIYIPDCFLVDYTIK